MYFNNLDRTKTNLLVKINPWNIFSPSTPLLYLSLEKSRKLLLYKHMAML